MAGTPRHICMALILAAATAHAQEAPRPVNGEEPPSPFVPLRPRTAEDRARVDAAAEFAAARSLERQGRRVEAIQRLQEALKAAPDSAAILRRLALLNLSVGRLEAAAEASRKVLEVEPEDAASISFLVRYHLQKRDPASAVALLDGVLKNPKLPRTAPAYLVAARELGDLCAGPLRDTPRAADAYAKLLDPIDEKAANALSPADLRRVLGDDPALAYQQFGEVFYDAKRYDLAARAFRRGLDYDATNVALPRDLALALLRLNRPAEALEALEPFLRRQPPGREPYEALAEILAALKRSAEYLPKLADLARADPKNLPLQYLLADRYRADGQPAKAEAIYKELIAGQADLRGFAPLAATLFKEKRLDDLIRVLGEAAQRPDSLEAVQPQIELITTDVGYADALLAAGIKQLEAEPPTISDNARKVLMGIALNCRNFDKLVAMQRLVVRRAPSVVAYRELCDDQFKGGKYADAGDTLEALLAAFPDERKDPQSLGDLCRFRFLAGRYDDAIAAAREGLGPNPAEAYFLGFIGLALARQGMTDAAIAHYRDMIARFPDDEKVLKRAHNGLSTLYVDLGQFDKGERELEQIYRREPDDPLINNDLGYLYADRGHKLEQAEAMIRKAVDSEPENHSYLDSLGWVLYKREKLAEALEPLQKATQDPTADATASNHLGDVYFRLKRFAEARASWEAAEKLATRSNPPDKQVEGVREKLKALSKLGPGDAPGGNNP